MEVLGLDEYFYYSSCCWYWEVPTERTATLPRYCIVSAINLYPHVTDLDTVFSLYFLDGRIISIGAVFQTTDFVTLLLFTNWMLVPTSRHLCTRLFIHVPLQALWSKSWPLFSLLYHIYLQTLEQFPFCYIFFSLLWLFQFTLQQ